MSQNISAPYIIQINEPFQTIHLTDDLNNLDILDIQIDSNSQKLTTVDSMNGSQLVVESTGNPIEIVRETRDQLQQRQTLLTQEEEQPCIVQIVYPQDLCLSPAQNVVKRGRPKKKKQEGVQVGDNSVVIKPEVTTEPPKSARTRSGRLVKLPKYIEKDFKKIETATEEQEVQVSDFKRFEEKGNSNEEFAELQIKKRIISAQYKCPKCSKAYLGKNKMIQHLKKYPDHGPLPEGFQEFNFDVWNYLFDITQKCKSGQRGTKFCEELSNLLHNVQLLKSALFKTVTDNKNNVQIDKVLGNAIGLPPGRYKFDENELYKDVTVFKLITNSDFFKPNASNKQVSDSTTPKNKVPNDILKVDCENEKINQDEQHTKENFLLVNNQQKEICHDANFCRNNDMKNGKHEESIYSFKSKSDHCENNTFTKKVDNLMIKTDGAISNGFSKKMDVDNVDNQILPSDLLTDNLLLHSLPNPRNSVEDLMLSSVDNGSNLLDNSTSSDEVMNVDQFVNERFKKIIGPDVELTNTSLNLDLPSLELFQFHTS